MTAQALAVVRDYAALRRAVADWCAATGITRTELDARAGLAEGHSNKLLAPKAVKKFGSLTFGPVLNATGLALIVVQDDEALAVIEQQLKASETASARRPHWRQRKDGAWSRRMNGKRTLKLTAQQRSDIARKGAQARWQR